MNTLSRSLKLASLFAVATVGLVGFAAIAQDCAGRKAGLSNAAPQDVPDRGNNGGVVRTEFDQHRNGIDVSFNADAGTDGGKTLKLAAIALAAIGGSSTIFLAYRSWMAKKGVSPSTASHLELEHPELTLTQVPQEALTAVQPEAETGVRPLALKR